MLLCVRNYYPLEAWLLRGWTVPGGWQRGRGIELYSGGTKGGWTRGRGGARGDIRLGLRCGRLCMRSRCLRGGRRRRLRRGCWLGRWCRIRGSGRWRGLLGRRGRARGGWRRRGGGRGLWLGRGRGLGRGGMSGGQCLRGISGGLGRRTSRRC